MNLSAVTGGLYPFALALANIGVGVGLYLTGALFFALLLWTSAALVLAALVTAAGRAPSLAGAVTE
jgi:hypothetical protein